MTTDSEFMDTMAKCCEILYSGEPVEVDFISFGKIRTEQVVYIEQDNSIIDQDGNPIDIPVDVLVTVRYLTDNKHIPTIPRRPTMDVLTDTTEVDPT